MQDKWASLVHGRPSHVSATDWAVHGLNDQDFPESFADEDDEDGSTEVVFHVYDVPNNDPVGNETSRRSSDATNHVLIKVKPLQIRLKQWYSGLPGCSCIEYVRFRKLSSSGYLPCGLLGN